MINIVPHRPSWSAEFQEIAAYADVKDPAVDLIHFAAEEWASPSDWQP